MMKIFHRVRAAIFMLNQAEQQLQDYRDQLFANTE
jgi:hypothetical protein